MLASRRVLGYINIYIHKHIIYIYTVYYVCYSDSENNQQTNKTVEVMMLGGFKPLDLKSVHYMKKIGFHFLNMSQHRNTTCNSLCLVDSQPPGAPSRGMLPLLCLPCPGQRWKKGPRRVVHYHGTEKKHQKSMLSCSMDLCGCCFHCFKFLHSLQSCFQRCTYSR